MGKKETKEEQPLQDHQSWTKTILENEHFFFKKMFPYVALSNKSLQNLPQVLNWVEIW